MNNNQNNSIYTPKEGPPKSHPSKLIYKTMGKENFYKMTHDFYTLLSKSAIKDMFPKDPSHLKHSSEKTAEFLIQLCGGPQLYKKKHGSPQMRKKHLPFKIDKKAQQEWLKCFMETIENAPQKYQFPEEHLKDFKQFIQELSLWMINTKS